MLEPRFISGTAGRLFCVVHLPESEKIRSGSVPSVLVVPAFADEMNKTRPTVTRIARGLNAQGIAVVIPDLYGTGDSDGDFHEAEWDQWCRDLETVVDYANASGLPVEGLLCIRSGVLLMASAFSRIQVSSIRASVWLQPVLEGNRYLEQQLRVRSLGKAVSNGHSESVQALRTRLQNGETLNVGGYRIPGSMATALSSISAAEFQYGAVGDICSIEATRLSGKNGESETSLNGTRIRNICLSGEPYWNSTEIVVIPEIVSCAIRHFSERLSA